VGAKPGIVTDRLFDCVDTLEEPLVYIAVIVKPVTVPPFGKVVTVNDHVVTAAPIVRVPAVKPVYAPEKE
jgi:hypothetical protein